jgi:hypothetical protein
MCARFWTAWTVWMLPRMSPRAVSLLRPRGVGPHCRFSREPEVPQVLSRLVLRKYNGGASTPQCLRSRVDELGAVGAVAHGQAAVQRAMGGIGLVELRSAVGRRVSSYCTRRRTYSASG